MLQAALHLLPVVLVVTIGIVTMLAMVQALLTDQQVQGQLVILMLMAAAGWLAWSKLPSPIRSGARRLMTRGSKRERH